MLYIDIIIIIVISMILAQPMLIVMTAMHDNDNMSWRVFKGIYSSKDQGPILWFEIFNPIICLLCLGVPLERSC